MIVWAEYYSLKLPTQIADQPFMFVCMLIAIDIASYGQVDKIIATGMKVQCQ